MPPSQPILLRAPNGEVAWTLIELQGAIESRNGAASLDGIEFGKLTEQVRRASFYSLSLPSLIRTRAMCPQEGKAPLLVMGKQQLEGEFVKLKKPLAIMSLVKPKDPEDGPNEYHAAGVVRQKLVFKTRPIPVPRERPPPEQPALVGSKRARADEPSAADKPADAAAAAAPAE